VSLCGLVLYWTYGAIYQIVIWDKSHDWGRFQIWVTLFNFSVTKANLAQDDSGRVGGILSALPFKVVFLQFSLVILIYILWAPVPTIPVGGRD
jgi:hypothetical protein